MIWGSILQDKNHKNVTRAFQEQAWRSLSSFSYDLQATIAL